MGTISENLQTIKNSTFAIKQAIVDKGGTINGDITTWANSIADIPSGGSGGSNSSGGAYALVEHNTNDTTYTLTPNTFHVWGEVAALTLTFGEEQSGVANEYLFQFESGSEATTLALPDGIVWSNGDTPVIESKCTYQISILNGLATIMKFNKPIVVISFTIEGTSYQAEEGMTWGEWVNTGYNVSGYLITNNNINNINKGTNYVITQNYNRVVINDTIISNYNYYLEHIGDGSGD